jgi:hypothetical protein
MGPSSFQLLRQAVLLLALVTVAGTAVIYLLMSYQNRRILDRQARRAALQDQLVPPLTFETFHSLWHRCRPADHEVIEEILLELYPRADPEEAHEVEKFLLNYGIYACWIAELKSGNAARRVRAAIKLGHLREPRGVEALVAAATGPSPEVQLAVTLALGRMADPAGLPALARMAREPQLRVPSLTLAAALAACAQPCPDKLVESLRAPLIRTRIIAAWALSEVADASVLPALTAAVQDPEPEVRAKVARALGRIPGPESVEILKRLARDRIWYVRVRALTALGKHGAPSARGTLLQGLDDPAPEVRARAAFALRQVWGLDPQIMANILTTRSRRSINSLISEWDRTGFLYSLVAGLVTRDMTRFAASRDLLKMLIAAGMTQTLPSLVLVFPDVKVRLRLVRLLLQNPSSTVAAELKSLADKPECDARVAKAIRRAVTAGVLASKSGLRAEAV